MRACECHTVRVSTVQWLPCARIACACARHLVPLSATWAARRMRTQMASARPHRCAVGPPCIRWRLPLLNHAYRPCGALRASTIRICALCSCTGGTTSIGTPNSSSRSSSSSRDVPPPLTETETAVLREGRPTAAGAAARRASAGLLLLEATERMLMRLAIMAAAYWGSWGAALFGVVCE